MHQKYRELSKNVAKSIQECRESVGMTQDQVGEKFEIGTEAVSRMERGVTIPTITRLAELADIFKCTIDDLLGNSSTRSQDQADYISKLLTTLPTEDREMVVDIVEKITHRLKDRL